jgi:signal transduction histidine kinase
VRTGMSLPKSERSLGVRKEQIKIALAISWLVLSVALAVWWLIFGLRQVARVGELSNLNLSELQRQHQMIVGEGGFLILLLLLGGLTMIYFVWAEMRRLRQMREFFAALTHDIKTSLASLRVLGDSLEDSLANKPEYRLTMRMQREITRLELQLENSLYHSTNELAGDLIEEKIDFIKMIENLKRDWPETEIRFEKKPPEVYIKSDSRATYSLFRNLIQNAIIHGGASRVDIVQAQISPSEVHFLISDNGTGFSGDITKLGHAYHRPSETSGSGLGLYLVVRLAERMGGQVRFLQSDIVANADNGEKKGLSVEVILPVFENKNEVLRSIS